MLSLKSNIYNIIQIFTEADTWPFSADATPVIQYHPTNTAQAVPHHIPEGQTSVEHSEEALPGLLSHPLNILEPALRFLTLWQDTEPIRSGSNPGSAIVGSLTVPAQVKTLPRPPLQAQFLPA